MNADVDFLTAVQKVKDDNRHFTRHFLNRISINPTKTVTALGMQALPPPKPHPTGRPNNDEGDGLGAAKKKRAKAHKEKRLRKQLEDARAAGRGPKRDAELAILDDSGKGGGGGALPRLKDKDRAKGKGKNGDLMKQVPDGVKNRDSGNKNICISYNLGKCSFPNWRFSHVCWWCLKPEAQCKGANQCKHH